MDIIHEKDPALHHLHFEALHLSDFDFSAGLNNS